MGTNINECNPIENLEQAGLNNNDALLSILNNGVKLTSETDINATINMLVNKNIITPDNKVNIIKKLTDNLGLNSQLTPDAALMLIMRNESIKIVKLSDDNRDQDILLLSIDNDGNIDQESSGNILINFEPGLITDSSQVETILNSKMNAQSEVVGQSQQHLCDLQDDMSSDFVIQPFSQFLTNGMGSQAFHEDGHLLYRTDNETNSQELVADDATADLVSNELGANNENLVDNLDEDDLIEDADNQDLENLEDEETIAERKYTVQKGETIWDILQNDEFGYTETQANALIKKLRNQQEFLSTLKSKDIDTIYPGETISFPQDILDSVAQEESVGKEENKLMYTIKDFDTPGKVIFNNYSGANWGNIKEIMELLNMGDVIKVGHKIELKESVTLKNGTVITKKAES